MKKSNGTLYWYGPGGSVLAETDLSGNLIREFVYFNGARIARRDSAGSIYYFFSDHLGTARVMTNATGVTQQESTYYPFGGEQRSITNLVDNRYRFTGMERDAETGVDHTQFRKYAPIMARWLSPDPICSNCLDPQQLNRYSYVINDPVNLADPSGLNAVVPCGLNAEFQYPCPDGSWAGWTVIPTWPWLSGGGNSGGQTPPKPSPPSRPMPTFGTPDGLGSGSQGTAEEIQYAPWLIRVITICALTPGCQEAMVAPAIAAVGEIQDTRKV